MKSKKNLVEVLCLREREHLAIVGAGGKTSLLLALSQKLRDKKVVISTTTKIHRDEAHTLRKPVISLQEPGWEKRLRDCLSRKNQAVLIEEVLASGKLKGISPLLADELFLDQGIDYLLLEADGAAGRAIKAPSANEPVIPASVTMVVAMIGLDAIDQPFNQEKVFREKEFRDITGIKSGEKLVLEKVIQLIIDPRGLFKEAPPVSKIVFLNRLDLLVDKSQAFGLADLIADRKTGSITRVVVGSIKDDEYYIWY